MVPLNFDHHKHGSTFSSRRIGTISSRKMTSSATLGDQAPLLIPIPPSPEPRSSTSSGSGDEELSQPPQQTGSSRTGAWYQVVGTLFLALLIAIVSGLFTLILLHKHREHGDYTHVPLPKLNDPKILRYLGGMGPYIGGSQYPPPPCLVTQLHLLSRHGERYPTTTMARAVIRFANNISGNTFHGDLAFLQNWKFEEWINVPGGQLNQETLTGPAAGSVSMFKLGTELRGLYPGFCNFTTAGDRRRVLWSTPSQRVIDSAKYFARGFFGLGNDVEIQVIPATNSWANTLTPS